MRKYDTYKDSGIKWIGEIPSHWIIVKAKRIVQQVVTQCSDNKKIGLENIESFTGKFIFTESIFEGNGVEVKIGDIVYGKLRPYLCKVWLATFKCNAVGDFYVFRCTHANAEFIHKLFLSHKFTQICNASTYGAKMPRVSSSFILTLMLPIPPISEQQAIADYLKDKTSKIDQYIAQREKEVILFEELKQSEIGNAVTKGLNPNAPMKESGIPWIGTTPKHWEAHRNKDIFYECKDVVGENSSSYTLLSLTKQGVIIRDLTESKGKFPKDFDTYKIVVPNDMIFCLFDVDETPRTVGLSYNYGMITGAYNIFKVRRACTKYVLYYYLSVDNRKALRPLYKGLRKVVPIPSFMSAKIFLPPFSEQQTIVNYIDTRLAKIDKCISDLKSEIECLKEFKQRLISDAVTGQIKVID